MHRRFSKIVLAAVISAVMLTGCGEAATTAILEQIAEAGKEKTESEGTDGQDTEKSEQEDEKETASAEEETTEDETQKSDEEKDSTDANDGMGVSIGNNLMIQSFYEQAYDNEKGGLKYSLRYDTLELGGDAGKKYPKLSAALSEYTRTRAEQGDEQNEELKSLYQDSQDEGYLLEGQYLFDWENILIRRADEKILSFLTDGSSYTGGVHGIYGYGSCNFDPKTGEKVSIDQVVSDVDALPGLIEERLKEINPDVEFIDLEAALQDYVRRVHSGDGDFVWSMEPDGVTFYFSPYEIAAYAVGELQAKITYAEKPELFKKGYFEDAADKSYVVEFGTNQQLFMDTDGDGKQQSVTVYGYENDGGYIEQLTVESGKAKCETDYWGYRARPLFVHLKTGENFVFVQGSFDNDYSAVFRYRLENDKLTSLDTISGSVLEVRDDSVSSYEGLYRGVWTDPEDGYICSRLDVLSTLSGWKSFSVDQDGSLKAEQDYRFFGTHELKAIKEIEGQEVDEKTGEATGEKITVQSGDTCKFYRTDGSSYVDFRLSDDRIVRFSVKLEWPQQIEGKAVEEYFEGMFYAG